MLDGPYANNLVQILFKENVEFLEVNLTRGADGEDRFGSRVRDGRKLYELKPEHQTNLNASIYFFDKLQFDYRCDTQLDIQMTKTEYHDGNASSNG